MKKLFILTAFFAVAAVAVIGGSSAVSADPGHGGGSAYFERYAEALGLAPEDVEAAVAQARSERQVARMEAKLAAAVAAGVITEEESAAIADWYAGKPDALQPGSNLQMRTAVEAGTVDQFLADLVAQEMITAQEADEISAWFEVRPTATDELHEWNTTQNYGGKQGLHDGKGMGRGRGGMGQRGNCMMR